VAIPPLQGPVRCSGDVPVRFWEYPGDIPASRLERREARKSHPACSRAAFEIEVERRRGAPFRRRDRGGGTENGGLGGIPMSARDSGVLQSRHLGLPCEPLAMWSSGRACSPAPDLVLWKPIFPPLPFREVYFFTNTPKQTTCDSVADLFSGLDARIGKFTSVSCQGAFPLEGYSFVGVQFRSAI